MQETKKLKIRVTQRKTKEGRPFNVYHTFSKNDRKTEVKFKSECNQKPEKDCYIIVAIDKMNLNKSGEYPVLWVSEVIAIEDLAVAQAEKNRQAINEWFGE